MSTLILDATTKSIEVVMSGAANSTNPDFTSSYADSTATTFTEGSGDGVLNGTTPVTLVAAPSASTQRVVKSISIQNRDDAAVTLTISYNNDATLRQTAVVTLDVGDTWTLNGTYTNAGSLKQSNESSTYLTADSGSITSNFGTIDNGASTITTTGTITGGTLEATADTSAGDNSAIGYTATEGVVVTGQGSTNDVTVKNDADATVLGIPTGTSNVTLGVDGTASDIIMTEKSAVRLDPAGGADGDYSGITFVGTAGATVAFGDVVYLKAADSEWYLADADAVATSGTVAIAICVSAGTNGNPVTLMTHGIIRADAGFPALTIGAPVYISLTGTTTNTVTVTAPSATDDVVKIVGYAITADEMIFNPSPDHITIV